MSTKINTRSPFYLDITEPTPPLVEFTCSVANASGLSIDQAGIITMPSLAYGDIDSYTSSDSGFSGGKYATVSTDTLRTIVFTILIPDGFSNTDDRYINCTLTATQPELVCSGGVTATGSIPNQTINANGNSVNIDLSSYFTQGVLPISEYKITNPYPNFIQSSVSGSTLTLTTLDIGGTETINIEATDGDELTCDATQNITITVNNLPAFDCTTANLTGGSIAQDGTITDPLTRGTIEAKSLTSGGAHITSVPANTGSTAQNVTLFFDITVPTGYSNEGVEIICSKTFVQQAPVTLPTFDCDTAALSGQAIYTSGSVLKGNITVGTIESFTPISFDEVTSITPRDITFKVRVPLTGYSNNNALIDCVKTISQPAISLPPCGTNRWSYDILYSNYTTAADIVTQATNQNRFLRVDGTYLQTSTTVLSSLVGTSICFNDARTLNGSGFIPVRQNYVGKLNSVNYITVLEVEGYSIVGVWEYNNNFYSTGYKSITQLY